MAHTAAFRDELLSVVEVLAEVVLALPLILGTGGFGVGKGVELGVDGLAEEKFGGGVEGQAKEEGAHVDGRGPAVWAWGGDCPVQVGIVSLFEVKVGDLLAGEARA